MVDARLQMPDAAQANVPPFEYVDVPVSAQGGAAQQEQHSAAAAASQYSHGGQYDAAAYGQGQQYASSVGSQAPGYGASSASQYGGYAAPAAPQYTAPAPPPAATSTAPTAYNQSVYDPAGNYGKTRQTYLQSYPSAEPKAPAYQAPPAQAPPLQPQHSGYSAGPAVGAGPRRFTPKPQTPAAPTSPYAQPGAAPSHPHSPGAGARAQQFAAEPPQQPAPRAVFQPMHAAAPRPQPQPQQMQPPQPPAPPAPPARPPGPPPDCSVYNVDTSNVSAHVLPVVQNLMGLYQARSLLHPVTACRIEHHFSDETMATSALHAACGTV